MAKYKTNLDVTKKFAKRTIEHFRLSFRFWNLDLTIEHSASVKRNLTIFGKRPVEAGSTAGLLSMFLRLLLRLRELLACGCVSSRFFDPTFASVSAARAR